MKHQWAHDLIDVVLIAGYMITAGSIALNWANVMNLVMNMQALSDSEIEVVAAALVMINFIAAFWLVLRIVRSRGEAGE